MRRNGKENVKSVPLDGTEMTASMAPSMYSVEEKRPTKKRPDQHIERGMAEAATVS